MKLGRVALAGMALALLACPPPPPPPPKPAPPPPVAPPPPPPPSPAEVAAEAACNAQVSELRTWLRSVEGAGIPVAASIAEEGAQLVARGGRPIHEAAPLVHLGAKGDLLDGVGVKDPAALREELTRLVKRHRKALPGSPFLNNPLAHVAIDGSVPWSHVVEVVDAATASGIGSITFVFTNPSATLPKLPESAIDRDLARMQRSTPARRHQIVVELLAWVYQDCHPAMKVIARLSASDIASLKQVALDDLPEAIGACGCTPDLASVKALHWTLFGNPHPTSGATVGVVKRGSAGGTVFKAAGDAPWSSVHAKLIDAAQNGRRVQLVVDPAAAEAGDEDAKSKGKPGKRPKKPGATKKAPAKRKAAPRGKAKPKAR